MAQRSPEAMQPEALFAAAGALGLDELELPTRGWDDPAARFVERVCDLRQQYGIDVSVNFGDDYIARGAEQPTERFATFVERLCRPLGVQVVGTTSPAHAGRWLKDPPLSEQLTRLAAALKRLAPVAEAGGVNLAVENHADYRGHELASVFERVDSPAVGARLDTGNAFAAVEDPTAAAQALAPFTFSTHIKDVRVEAEPWGRKEAVPASTLVPGGLLVMLEVALGEGHVDFDAILPLLAAQGPLGDDLALTIEETDRTIGASVAYAREHFASYLRPARAGDGARAPA
jgi:sugar phosphate isomerase/epimerase